MMLSDLQIKNLASHVLGMFQAVIIPEITPRGYILSANQDGETYPDPVVTHHLVELCIEISQELTQDVIDRACYWFSETHANIQNPFLITTLAIAGKLSANDKRKVLEELLTTNQKPSGFIDVYAGFLDGGSAFSTLWAIRIASLMNDDSRDLIEKCFYAIDSHWYDLHRSSHKGFYYELSNQLRRNSLNLETSKREILENQDNSGLWDGSFLYTAYIIGNLLKSPDTIDPDCIQASSKALSMLFDLEKDATSQPKVFHEARRTYVDSTYLQFCLRSLISAIRYLRKVCNIDMQRPLSASIFGMIPRVYHTARILDSKLKEMNDQYGNIKKHFDHLEKQVVESILKENPYDRNVFIMVPFRHNIDERYERIVTSVKTVLERHNFKGWLASDKNLSGQLWDNVASFMLACRYGIAIFTRVEREHIILTREFNPNVSLELGFFLSRGKKVLILKDSPLESLQTDLVGHLYEQFELNQSGLQIPPIIEKWINALLDEEKFNQ